jgi:hypothetical protein
MHGRSMSYRAGITWNAPARPFLLLLLPEHHGHLAVNATTAASILLIARLAGWKVNSTGRATSTNKHACCTPGSPCIPQADIVSRHSTRAAQ